MLVKTANKFRSELKIQRDDMIINGKSIMGVMMLAAECGSELEIMLNGVDEEEAIIEIEKLFERKFDEEE
jgi:phosphocarrier protein